MEEQLPEDQINDSETKRESQIIRGDNLSIVDLRKYNTEGKEAHYVQINQIIGAVTEGKISLKKLLKERKWTSWWILLSRNPVEGATTKNIHDEQYLIYILTEEVELNLNYGRIFTSQPQQPSNSEITCEREMNNQSEANKFFEKKRYVNKIREQAETSPNKNGIKFKGQLKLSLPQSSKFTIILIQRNGPRIFSLGGRQQKSWKLSEDERTFPKKD